MLFDLAIDFECTGDASDELLDRQEQDLYDNAGQWFNLLARLPYDGTYTLETFLDCCNEMLRHFLLSESYMIDVVQLGFGFRQLKARRRWVAALENLLYTFNTNCKFMMPCKEEPPALRYLATYSQLRAPALDTYMPDNALYSRSTTEMDKPGDLKVLYRFLSMSTSLEHYSAK